MNVLQFGCVLNQDTVNLGLRWYLLASTHLADRHISSSGRRSGAAAPQLSDTCFQAPDRPDGRLALDQGHPASFVG